MATVSNKGAKESSPTPKNYSLFFWITGAVSVLIGLWQSITLRWVSDDAFITFRYVKHFTEGKGIVYNVGEYVEGYTHFLWLLLLSVVRFIGFDQVDASMWMGIGCYVFLLIIYILISKKEKAIKTGIIIPTAAILLALNIDMQIWATGGLETSLYTLLISSAFYCWFYTKIDEVKKLLLVGTLLFLTTLTRPDGALFVFTAILLIATQGIRNKVSTSSWIKRIGFLILPSLIIGIPYLFWKYYYYGNLLPNTYYTKSADESYFTQGLFYIWLFFKVYFSAAVALIVLGTIALVKKRSSDTSEQKFDTGSPETAAIVAAVIYLLLYVARVGGDFMFARFIIPILPLLYYLIERGLSMLMNKKALYTWAAPLLLIGAVLFENHWRDHVLIHLDITSAQEFGNWDDSGGGETQGIADERWVYMRDRMKINGVFRSSMDVYSEIGKFYEPFFRDLPITVAINGAQNVIAYYADFQTVINGYGLTDSAIAHSPIIKRGRIGHEKMATEEYLRNRHVLFQLYGIAPKIPDQLSYNMAIFSIPEFGLVQLAKMITYDKQLIAELDKHFHDKGVRPILPHYEEILPRYIMEVMPTLSAERVEADYRGFKQLYLDKYPDPDADREILRYIDYKHGIQKPK